MTSVELDLVEAHPAERWDEGWWEGVFLVLSNFALVPVIARLLRKHDWATASNYVGILLVSSLYHMCRAGVVCLFEYKLHRIADYLFVYRALVWTFASLVARPGVFGRNRSHVARASFHFAVMVPVTLVLLGADHTSHWIPIIGFVFPLAVATAVTATYRVPFVNDWTWGTLALALFAVGGALGFALPNREYKWAHTLWHVFVMLSMYGFVRATE